MNFLNADESNEFDTLNKKSIKHSSSIVMSKASNESYGISCQHILSLTEINEMVNNHYISTSIVDNSGNF